MAVPILARPALPHELLLPIQSLREWLQDSWALLFSHPDDFACYGFEADRWLMHVRQAFSDTGIRPLTLASPDTKYASGWIYEMGGGAAVDADDLHAAAISLDDSEQAFGCVIANSGTRFVMVVDDSLRVHRTFSYALGDRLPSPIELVWRAEALRLDAIKRRMKVLRCASASRRSRHRSRLRASGLALRNAPRS